jgi:hypothetical protein
VIGIIWSWICIYLERLPLNRISQSHLSVAPLSDQSHLSVDDINFAGDVAVPCKVATERGNVRRVEIWQP